MNIPADFIRDVGKHIARKYDLQKGDTEAWAKWFDKLEFYSNLSCAMAKGIEDDITTLEAENARLTKERDEAREALRPFADAHIAAENDDIDDDTYETGEGFYMVDIYHWQQAARVLREDENG